MGKTTRPLPGPTPDESSVRPGQERDGSGPQQQRRHPFPATQKPTLTDTPLHGVPEADAPGSNAGGPGDHHHHHHHHPSQGPDSASSAEGGALHPDDPAAAEHADAATPAQEGENEAEEEEEEEEEEEDESGDASPSSARSEVPPVGFPGESQHRALVRRVRAEMSERLEETARRKRLFLERSRSALRRSQGLTLAKAARRAKRCSPADTKDC